LYLAVKFNKDGHSVFNQETETYGKYPCWSRKKMEATKPLPYEYIDTPAGLEAVARALESEPVVAVDLEADSMYHFKEKVCLIQMASATTSFVIDPLKLTDFSSIRPIFSRTDIQKVFHGSDYDVRSLYRDFGIEINNLFDTELASRFLGITETGLEAVLLNRFNVRLDKKYQKKDWSQRPLPVEMIDYASQDAIYLVLLAAQLEGELVRLGRRDWVAEECALLSRVRPNDNDELPLFIKFKGAGRLYPRSLAILESLLQFRKQMAEKKDRPVFKILSNRTLSAIATEKPTTFKELETCGSLSPTQLGMYGKPLFNLTKMALELPESDLPRYPRQKLPSMPAVLPRRLGVLKEWRDKKAEALGMDPALICNKALMYAIATVNPSDEAALGAVEHLKKWQQKAFGGEILSALSAISIKRKR
jgi:ribonuclease D